MCVSKIIEMLNELILLGQLNYNWMVMIEANIAQGNCEIEEHLFWK